MPNGRPSAERPAAEDAAKRQDDQRPGHDRLALVSVGGRVAVVAMAVAVAVCLVKRVLFVVNVRVNRLGRRREAARLAGEGQEPHPEHVERRQAPPRPPARRRAGNARDSGMTRASAAARIASFE